MASTQINNPIFFIVLYFKIRVANIHKKFESHTAAPKKNRLSDFIDVADAAGR